MDRLCLKSGIHALPPSIPVSGAGFLEVRANPSSQISANAVGRPSTAISVENPSVSRNLPSGFSFRFPLRSLWPKAGENSYDDALAVENAVLVEEKEENKHGVAEFEEGLEGRRRDENWVFMILHVRSLWKQGGDEAVRIRADIEEGNGGVLTGESFDPSRERPCSGGGDEECEVCTVNYFDDDDRKSIDFDKESFSKLLRRVSLGEARLYRQMSQLGNLAYSIPQIKPQNLMRVHGLRYVTSSLEKKEQKLKADKEKALQKEEKACSKNQRKQNNETAKNPQLLDKSPLEALDVDRKVDGQVLVEEKVMANQITAAAAYQIAASAASYLQSHTISLLPFKSKSIVNPHLPGSTTGSADGANVMNEEVASVMATTDSVTAVVAAKEEVKQAVADELKSAHSSPCEWFICDDERNATRFFVIQGSESMASWQANLLFEPVQFEGFDVLVHRGIYEAAKGIYEQMLPEVRSHLKSFGKRASFRFTGHSLGGSLSLLINLMLLIRGEVPSSSLLPVITFGSPTIMCGGDHLLHKLGLSPSHVKAITMHRDIVPRAFSCGYPNHVAEFLKAVNGNFRCLPCLTNQKLLYAPMGEFIILQPDEKFSPNHHLLPDGSGLYLLSCPASDSSEAERQMQAAKAVFLNSPHPLEILSDRGAYGSGGTIQRDHDMGSYVRSVKNVIREELMRTRKAKREGHRREWWRLVVPTGVNPGTITGKFVASSNTSQGQFNFGGMIDNGKESLKRIGRLVESQHMHLLVVLLFPARLLILGAFSAIGFR